MQDFDNDTIYNKYLLIEKDHRNKMIKFGVPEDVANYLHELDDKRSIWIADQIKDMEEYQNTKAKLAWVKRFVDPDYREILDWISNVPNIILKKYTWDEALEASREWHKSLESNKLEKQEENNIIKKYSNGYYWVDLESSRCREEGDLMGHCGTTDADTIFSLRSYDQSTNTIDGHVSIAISPDDGVWRQAKGKSNSKPKQKYFKYIIDILMEYDVYGYYPEYNPESDFGKDDFIGYVRNNSNEFTNAEDIIYKIDEASPNAYKKALKLLEQYNFDYFDVDIFNYDDDEYVAASAVATINIKIPYKLDEDVLYADNTSEEIYKAIYESIDLSIPENIDIDDNIEYNYSQNTLKIDIIADSFANEYNMGDIPGLEYFLDSLQFSERRLSNIDVTDIRDILVLKGVVDSYFFKMYKHYQEKEEEETFNNLPEMDFYSPYVFDDEFEDSMEFRGIIMLDGIPDIPKDKLAESLLYGSTGKTISLSDDEYYTIAKKMNHPFYYILETFLKTGLCHNINFKRNTDDILYITLTDFIDFDSNNDTEDHYKREYMDIKKKDSFLDDEKERFIQFFNLHVKPKIKTAQKDRETLYKYEWVPEFVEFFTNFENRLKRELSENPEEDKRQMNFSFKDFYNNT